MIEIKDLLSRFDHILLSGESKKNSIGKIIGEVINLDIKSEDMTIKNGTVYLNIKPIYKNEIFIKREKIDLALEKMLGEKYSKDIR